MARRITLNGRVFVDAADYERLESSLAQTLEMATTLFKQVAAGETSVDDASTALRGAARMDK